MSAAVSTSRAAPRTSNRDKINNRPMTQNTNRHSDGPGGGTAILPKEKYQPTQEQINIAHITNMNDDELTKKKINQLVEMTGKNEDEVAVALLDCKDDVERAALMLLEGGDNTDQGEWKSQGKKKKPKNATPLPPPPAPKNDNTQNHMSDKPEYKRDRSRDRDQDSSDRYNDGSSRRGRRNGAPPPRFARGRGRDRNFYGGDRNENGEDTRENGFDNRDRSGGRGRGRGGFGRRGRGRGMRGGGSGDIGGEFQSEKSPKFDKEPQIDTWTNETAEISQKEPAGWGQTWGAEDWNEDSWTGNLCETQVFTATSARSQEGEPTPVSTTTNNDSSSHLGQRLDLGILLQKPNEIQAPKQSTYNMSQYNQQATESIKNCIGIGASRPPAMSNLQSNQSQSLGPVGSMSQSVQSNSLSTSQALQQQSLSGQQALQQQRAAKIQRSKLPPPSKIPASAVEMPGHRMPMLDVQFGVDFGSNEPAALSFGSADTTVNNRMPTSVTNSPPSLNNHLNQMNATNTADSMTSSIMASPSAGSKSGVMSALEQSTRSSSLFQSSAYSSPPKNDSQSVLNQTKMTPPDPIQFPTDRKSSPLVTQRPSQNSSNTMGQGSLSSSQDASSLSSSFGQSATSYPSSGSYQGHKGSSLPGSQSYTHTTNSQSSTYPSPYQSSQNQYQTSSNQYQSSQNQYQASSNQTPYQTSQNQYQSTQNQYPSGQSQYSSTGQQSYSNYPSGGSSFQSPSGFSSNQSNSSSLYQNSAQASGAFSGQSSVSQGTAGYSGQSSVPGTGYSGQGSGTGYSGQTSSQGSGSFSGQSSNQNSGAFSGQNSVPSGGYSGQSGGSQTTGYSGQNSSQSSVGFSAQGASQSSGGDYSGQSASQSSGSYPGQSSSSQGSSAFTGQSSSYHMRDTQSSNSANAGSSNQYQTQSPSLATSPSPSQTGYSAQTSQSSYNVQPTQTHTGYSSQTVPSQTNFSAQSFSSSSTLQTSPLTTSKLGDSLTKMTLKDSGMDSHENNQFDHSSVSTPGITATTSTSSSLSGSVSSVNSTSAAMTTISSSRISSITSNSVSTSKAPPNLPPGVPLVGTPQQYIMGQAGAVPSFYSLQQPMYGYEDQMQLLQQRVPLANNYYDMTAAYQVPSSLSGRDQPGTLGNVSYSVTSDSSKLNRVDAQSPNPSTQQPTSQSAHQPYFYGYYYPQVLPGSGFQIPTMYPMPAVTNTPHASTTATTQFQKTFGSHGYGTKGYDELSQVQDYAKTAYGVTQPQTKVTAGTRSAADLAGSSYTKSHSQAFDKQGFHAGTPPPFMPHGNASQTPLGAPTNPYAAAAPFVQMMAPHNQMLHHIQQDSAVSSRISQQTTSHSKTGVSKAYGGTYWGAS